MNVIHVELLSIGCGGEDDTYHDSMLNHGVYASVIVLNKQYLGHNLHTVSLNNNMNKLNQTAIHIN